MNTQHMDDLNRASCKLTKDKIENVTPTPISEYEKNLINTMHVLSLPTIGEIYREIGLELLKYAIGIGYFLLAWWVFSNIMDIVFA